ncbi:MAG TPA: hypothetical protein VF893_02160 [Candidatus Bathyarchaeia archaeon]
MKRSFLSAFWVLMLCSLILLVSIGTAKAYLANYSYAEWGGFTITFDGKWTSSGEWAGAPWMDLSSMAQFRGVVDMTSGTLQYNIIEFFTDTTNDAGDYWQICMENTETGASAPGSVDYRIELVGHSTLKVYQGNGTGWTLLASPPAGFAIKDSLSTSPLSSTPHWQCEIQIDKVGSPINAIPPIGIRVACYDASNAAAGEQAWPPNSVSSVNIPAQWGSISGYAGDIPEGVSFGVVLLLSSAAAIVGSYYLRKRPKTTNLNITKL